MDNGGPFKQLIVLANRRFEVSRISRLTCGVVWVIEIPAERKDPIPVLPFPRLVESKHTRQSPGSSDSFSGSWRRDNRTVFKGRERIDEGSMTANAHTNKQPWRSGKDHLGEVKRRQEAREKHTTTTGYG